MSVYLDPTTGELVRDELAPKTHPAADAFPMAVRAVDPDTCRTAAQRASVSAGTNRALALRAHAHADAGLTDFELADLTGIPQTSIGKRRGELVVLGLVERTELRRPSPSGSPAIVWRITAEGLRQARQVVAA